jgi:hypothetical protein
MIKANEDTDQDGLNNEEEIRLLINPTKKILMGINYKIN